MKFSVSTPASGAGPRTGRALRGELEPAEATTFWQAHEDEAEHLTLVFRAHAQRPTELLIERDLSIKLYAMSACDALAMATRFVDHARALEERSREAPPDLAEDAVWTDREAIPISSHEERGTAILALHRAIEGLEQIGA